MPDVPGGNVQFSFFLQKEMIVKNCGVTSPRMPPWRCRDSLFSIMVKYLEVKTKMSAEIGPLRLVQERGHGWRYSNVFFGKVWKACFHAGQVCTVVHGYFFW